jgi:putative ABC transport system ATP-binding protein
MATKNDGHGATPFVRLAELFRPERAELWMIMWYAVVVGVFWLATPIAIEALVSTVQFGVLLWPVLWLALVLLACLTLMATVQAAEVYVIEVLQRRLFVRLASDFATHLPRVRFDVHDHTYVPEVTNRFFDVLTIQKATATLLLDGVTLVMSTAIGLLVLALYHPVLLGFGLVLIVALIVLGFMGRGAIASSLQESQAKYALVAWLEELARTPRSFKVGNGPRLAREEADRLAHDYLTQRHGHFRILYGQTVFAFAIQVAASGLLLGLGGILVIDRQLTFGQLIAAEVIVTLVAGNLAKLGKYLELWYDLCTAVEKVGHVMDLPLERVTGEALPPARHGMAVAVERVAWGGHAPVLGGVSWTVRANEKVALAGPSGSGKTTLLDILAGFREPTEGHVAFDGIDSRSLRLESVREHVAVVHGVEVFAGTIEENLRVGRTDVTLADISAALGIVGLTETVRGFPTALETPLMPSGLPLSAGEAIRLGIARALLGRPRLLLLDGVLDQLDLRDSPALLPTLFAADAPWTLILVSHDPEILACCERVLGVAG